MIKVMTGAGAFAEGIRVSKPHTVSAYPITPQTDIVKTIAKMIAERKLECNFVNVESEQAAMAIVHGVALTGKRVSTFTSSHGLWYMAEMLYAHTTLRLPLLFGDVTRAMGMPFNIWSDHSDPEFVYSFPAVQFFCSSAQEILDHVVIGYRLAEEDYFTVIAFLEGFLVSHAAQPVEILEQNLVDKFLPPFKPRKGHFIDPDDSPKTFGGHDLFPNSEFYDLLRRKTFSDLKKTKENYKKIANEFAELFGRKYEPIETYRTEDAELVLVALGVTAHTAKVAVDELREKGVKCGLVRILMIKPFPEEEFIESIGKSKTVIVLESDNTGVFFKDLAAAFCGRAEPKILGSIIGIGGREITPETIKKIISKSENRKPKLYWEEEY